jgi:hypothetical protein
MFIFIAAQIVAGVGGSPVDCLVPLTTEERRQDDAVRASKRKAANLPILEPDEDLLPVDSPANFKPVLVILSYTLNSTGSVSDCTIQKPSGIGSLDNASCALLRRHLKIQATAQSSKPQKVAINWTPRAVRPERRVCNTNGGAVPISGDRWISSSVFSGAGIQSGSAFVALDVGATGRITNCVVKAATISKTLQSNLCNMAIQRAVVLPALDREGQPIATKLLFVARFVVR